MTRWILGNALIAAGLAWVAAYGALRGWYPLNWGGPNIGAGFTVVVAYAAVLAGVILLIIDLTGTRSGRPDRARRRPRTPPVLAALAAVAAVAMFVAPPGPGGSGIVGDLGVTVDAAGEPVLVLVVCERSVSTVRLHGPYRGGPNEVYGELRAPADIAATTLLPLSDLPAGWAGGPIDLPLEERPDDLVLASADGEQSMLRSVGFTDSDLTALDPARMLVGGDRRLPVDQASTLCR